MRTLLALVSITVASAALAAPAPSVPDLLARHVQAVGPIDKIQSRRTKLRVIGMAPFDIPVTVEARRPNLIRKEVVLQGAVQVTAFDGTDAWKTDPFIPGGDKPAALPADERRSLMEEADFDGALVNAAAKGVKVAYVGPGQVDGKNAHVLRVTIANGDEARVYLDASSLLEVRRVQTRSVMGKMTELEINSSDYRLVDGIRIPHRVDIGAPGSKQRMSIVIDAVAMNVPLEPARFALPR